MRRLRSYIPIIVCIVIGLVMIVAGVTVAIRHAPHASHDFGRYGPIIWLWLKSYGLYLLGALALIGLIWLIIKSGGVGFMTLLGLFLANLVWLVPLSLLVIVGCLIWGFTWLPLVGKILATLIMVGLTAMWATKNRLPAIDRHMTNIVVGMIATAVAIVVILALGQGIGFTLDRTQNFATTAPVVPLGLEVIDNMFGWHLSQYPVRTRGFHAMAEPRDPLVVNTQPAVVDGQCQVLKYRVSVVPDVVRPMKTKVPTEPGDLVTITVDPKTRVVYLQDSVKVYLGGSVNHRTGQLRLPRDLHTSYEGDFISVRSPEGGLMVWGGKNDHHPRFIGTHGSFTVEGRGRHPLLLGINEPQLEEWAALILPGQRINLIIEIRRPMSS